MVATRCVIVGGAVLPADSVLAPGSMLRAGASAERKLYSAYPLSRYATTTAASRYRSAPLAPFPRAGCAARPRA